jgi:hypothetical protein
MLPLEWRSMRKVGRTNVILLGSDVNEVVIETDCTTVLVNEGGGRHGKKQTRLPSLSTKDDSARLNRIMTK